MINNILNLLSPRIIPSILCTILLIGCNKQENPAGQSPSSATVSAEPNSFKEVTSRLDPGGNLYVYISTEQMLDGISTKISGWRKYISGLPNMNDSELENISKALDVVTNLIKASGLEDVSGLGMSSIAVEKGFYRSKLFIHHYPDKGQGFLWKIAGQKPHSLDGLDLLPTNTAAASFVDLDLPLVWSVIQKQVAQSGFDQAQSALARLPDQFEKATGLALAKVLDSLGGEFGIALTLNESKMIPIPLPTSEPFQIPEPGLLIAIKVKDDTIFNRVEEALHKTGQQIVSVDKPDLKMRTVPLPLPLPIEVRPTIAMSGGYLLIANTDSLIQDALAVKSGKLPGLKSTEEFKHLSTGIPDQGNQFTFFSKRFSEMMIEVQKQAMQMSNKLQPAQRQMLESAFQSERPISIYSVGGNTDEGWLSVGNRNK